MDEDPFILEGLNPHVQALTESAYTTYSTDRANTIYNNHVNTQVALVGDIIDHASIQGITLETGTDYEVLQADILARREEALAAGIRMADFDKHLVSTIAAKAIEHGDPMLLEMLEQTLPGYEVKLSSLPEFRDVKATTVAALEVEARRRMQDQADQQEAEDEAKEEAIIRGVMGTLAEDPSAQIPEAVNRLSRLSAADWERLKDEIRQRQVRVVALDLPTSHQLATQGGDEFTSRMLEAVNGMMLDMLAAIARKDYEDRRRRQAEGIQTAKGEGKYRGRPEDEKRNERIMELLREGWSWRRIQEHFEQPLLRNGKPVIEDGKKKTRTVSHSTLSRLAKRLKAEEAG